tara:strand:+ start:405 stop:878 length:474 start_codon:yes stop_codon:yes gene_type:complete
MGRKQMKRLLLLAALLIPNEAEADSQTCMAEAMYFEARGEGWRGMLAVGVVIRNRVDHPGYPSTICGVVRQGRLSDGRLRKWQCQFTFFCDGKPEDPEDHRAWSMAQSLSTIVIEGQVMLVGMENVTHYHTVNVKPLWAKQFAARRRIGSHIFYGPK